MSLHWRRFLFWLSCSLPNTTARGRAPALHAILFFFLKSVLYKTPIKAKISVFVLPLAYKIKRYNECIRDMQFLI